MTRTAARTTASTSALTPRAPAKPTTFAHNINIGHPIRGLFRTAYAPTAPPGWRSPRIRLVRESAVSACRAPALQVKRICTSSTLLGFGEGGGEPVEG